MAKNKFRPEANILEKIFKPSLKIRKYSKGDFIFHQGDIAKGIYRILDGRVKLWKYDVTYSKSNIYYLLSPSDIFGVVDFMNEERICRLSATAVDPVVNLQFVSYETFEKHFFYHTDARIELIKALIKLNEACVEKYFISKGSLLKERVYKAIKRIAIKRKKYSDNNSYLEHLSQKEISEYLGVSRQSVTQALNELKKEGKIKYDRSGITILDN